MTNAQFNRLPQYARDEIASLRAAVMVREREDAACATGKTDTRIVDRSTLGRVVPLPDGTVVEFGEADGPRIQCEQQGPVLRVYAPAGGRLRVEPEVANVVHLMAQQLGDPDLAALAVPAWRRRAAMGEE